MPWRDIGLNAAGLFLYPGLVAAAALGIVLESIVGWRLTAGRGDLVRPRSTRRAFTPRLQRHLPVHSVGAALLAAVAAIQLAAPYSPVPAGDRNLLTAAISLIGAAWILWIWGWSGREVRPQLLLTAQLAWLIALVVPAIIPQTLKPQTLGYVTISPNLPVKVACGLLYLLCLPALLNLFPESAESGQPPALAGSGEPPPAPVAGLRVLLWFPYCGLFASLFFSPGADNPLELFRFLGVVVAAAAITVAIAAVLIQIGAVNTRRFYSGVVVPFAWISLGVGMISAALASR